MAPSQPAASSATAGGGGGGDLQQQQQHAWEQTDSSQLWSQVQEDADGNLISHTGAIDEATLIRLRRKRLSRADYARSSRRLVRDMIRYVYLVIDLSRCMYDRDPVLPGGTRFDAVLSVVSQFVGEYYDQNPLSHLGLIVVRNGEAEMITRLTGSRTAHAAALVQIRKEVGEALSTNPNGAGGVFSLQNGLEVAGRSLGHMPRYGSREVVVIMGALATCDPGDLLVETLPRLKSASIRVSTVGLTAEVNVCRKISDGTGGIMGVCLDKTHLRDLIMGQCVPPPARPDEIDSDGNRRTRTCEFVQMGFPARRTDDVPSLVHAGRGDRALLARTAYICPRCQSKTAELPADCAVCGLKLVLAPHLARSFHHLFPVPPFAEVPEEVDVAAAVVESNSGAGAADATNGNGKKATKGSDIIGSSPPSCVSSDADVTRSSPSYEIGSTTDGVGSTRQVKIGASLLVSSEGCDRCCFGCLKIIGVHEAAGSADDDNFGKKRGGGGGSSNIGGGNKSDPNLPKPEPLRFQCPDCKNLFCADCDAYLHETLHNCPGCLCATT
mmetsp:Transcript_34268/g.75411  ORF Transcript_34268/g.75411 Transcript_34268/m.75411 type:complete len:553 (-) Transcript_34268:202-1860(-)